MNAHSSPPPVHGAENSPLGQPVAYCDTYTPDLLFPIERRFKRDELGMDPAALPFVGADWWNAYELSWLNPRGKPVVALARFTVPADSPSLIESKSLKLYLNAFNQSRYGDAGTVAALIRKDLSAAAGAPVGVAVVPLGDAPARVSGVPQGVCIDDVDVEIDTYQPPRPDLLRCAPGGGEVGETLYSHLLKSNCLVTGQPDWGLLAVRYRGAPIDRAGLLRYVVSFRKHDEFHEQCVERVFCDLMARCRPRSLLVWARYTRRGGLDINPWRGTPGEAPPPDMLEIRQ